MNRKNYIPIVFISLALLSFSAEAQSSFQYDPSGNMVAKVGTGAPSPVIEAQPQAGLFQTNGIVSFSVVAIGDGLSYQWLSNGVAIAGAKGATLLIANLPATASGSFSVVISNISGISVTSSPASLSLDSRGVGMPDWWQLQYFGNLDQPPDGDYDGDGVDNVDEYQEGTNPTNAASYDPRLYITDAIGGDVDVSPLQPYYTMGQTVTLTPVPDYGMAFLAWSGSISGLTNPATLVMNSHKSVEALFANPASIITWTNTSGGNWNVAANWSPNQVPGAADTVLITALGTYSVTLSDNESVDTLVLGAASGAQTFNISGGTFVLNGEGRGNTQTILNITGGTFAGTGTLVLAGPLNWTGGTISGNVQFEGGSFSGGNGGLLLNGGQLINSGTLAWGVIVNDGNGSIINNLVGATINVAANNSAGTYNSYGGVNTTYNAGQMTVVGTGNARFNDAFNNSGTVSINSGVFILSGGGSDSGAFAVAAEATLNLSGGTHTLNAGSIISGAGNCTVSGATAEFEGNSTINYTINLAVTISAGDVIFGPGGSLTIPALTMSGGAMEAFSPVPVNGPFNWSGGLLDTVVLQFNGGSFSGNLSLPYSQLINSGTLAWNAQINTGYGSVISNLAGATINLAANNSAGPYTFYNAGQLTVAGTGSATISDTFNNSGTVTVNSGTLVLSGGGSDSGAFTLAEEATLNLSGGTNVFNAGSTISGEGNLTVSGGTANLGGSVNAGGTYTFSGGTANLTGSAWLNDNMLVVSGGTVFFFNSGTIAPAVVNVSGGQLDGTALIADSGPLNWTGGYITAVVKFNGGSFSGNLSLPYSQLINSGTLAWNAQINTGYGSVISNLAGATINLAANNSAGTCTGCEGWPGPYTFYNAGQLTVAGTGSATISDTFNNSGTVTVNSGTLDLAGATSFTNGTLNFGISGLTNFGEISISGQAILGGALGVHFNNAYTPTPSNLFALINYASESGMFASLHLPASFIWQTNYGPVQFTLSVLGATPVLAASQMKNGASAEFLLQFTGDTNDNYTILASTNLGLPFLDWISLGSPALLSNNLYQFIDAQSTNFPARFYLLRSP